MLLGAIAPRASLRGPNTGGPAHPEQDVSQRKCCQCGAWAKLITHFVGGTPPISTLNVVIPRSPGMAFPVTGRYALRSEPLCLLDL